MHIYLTKRIPKGYNKEAWRSVNVMELVQQATQWLNQRLKEEHNVDYDMVRVEGKTTELRSVRCLLRCRNGREPVARMSSSGRRINSVNWETHKRWMECLFDMCPSLTIDTALAKYKGREDFLNKFEATYEHNAGSRINPVCFGAL
jgi:hypothetical protein